MLMKWLRDHRRLHVTFCCACELVPHFGGKKKLKFVVFVCVLLFVSMYAWWMLLRHSCAGPHIYLYVLQLLLQALLCG